MATAGQISISRPAAEAALAHIEDLGYAPVWETVDYGIGVLRGLRIRLRRANRLVPASAWPELEAFVRDTPGLVTELTPRIRVPEGERAALARALRESYRHLRELGAPLGVELVAIEGLIDALASRELVHGIGGRDLGGIVRDVLTMARADLRHLPDVARQLPR